MDDIRRLAVLRDQIALIEGETVFEGWAVGRVDREPGLVLLTNWRLIVADIGGGFSALPIAKIDRIDSPSPTTVRLTAWYEAISLGFESATAAATLVNRLRQDPACRATIGQAADLSARQPGEISADRGHTHAIAPMSTIDAALNGAATARADQHLLMAEPSL